MKRRESAGISTIQNLLFLLHSKPSLRQSHKIYNKALKLYGPLPNITWAYMFSFISLRRKFFCSNITPSKPPQQNSLQNCMSVEQQWTNAFQFVICLFAFIFAAVILVTTFDHSLYISLLQPFMIVDPLQTTKLFYCFFPTLFLLSFSRFLRM